MSIRCKVTIFKFWFYFKGFLIWRCWFTLKCWSRWNTYNILVMVSDSNRVQNFLYRTVAWVKMSLFLELMSDHLCILIIKKDTLILGKGLKQGLNDTVLTAESEYSINFSRSHSKFCLGCIIMGATFFYVLCYRNISIQSKRFWDEKILLLLKKFFRRFLSQ